MDLGLQGRVALVLGATSGLGRATAEALAAEGARVAVVGRRGSLVHELSERLGGHGIVADVTDPTTPQRLVEETEAALGPVEVVVLNGGGPAPGTADDFTEERSRAAVDLLLHPHVALVERVLPGMRAAGWGRVLAIASAGVQQPIPTLTSSNVGRAALAAYLKTLAGAVAADGVTVNLVLPGRIDTDRVAELDRAAAERSGRSVEETRTGSEQSIPAGRYGTPAELGAVVAFLASTHAAYVTGEQVRIDGGLVAGY